MKKKDLNELIQRYDKEKGLKKRLFSYSSDEIDRIKALADQKEVKESEEDERLPFSVIYQIHKIIQDAKQTAGQRLSGRLLKSTEELIKNYLPYAKEQHKTFDKIVAEYNLTLAMLNSHKKQIAQLERQLASGTFGLESTEKVKMELQKISLIIEEASNREQGFIQLTGTRWGAHVDNILDPHLQLKIKVFREEITHLTEANYAKASTIRDKLQSALSVEDKLKAENENMRRQIIEKDKNLQILGNITNNLSKAYAIALADIKSAQFSEQSDYVRQLTELKNKQANAIPPEMVTTIKEIIDNINEHITSSANQNINLKDINPQEILGVHAKLLEINYVLRHKNTIEKLIEKYPNSTENQSVITFLQNIANSMTHHVEKSQSQFYRSVAKILNQELANMKSATTSLGGIEMISDNPKLDQSLFDMSDIEAKINNLNIQDQAQLTTLNDALSAKSQGIQKRLESMPQGLMKSFAEDALKSVTNMTEAMSLFNTHASASIQKTKNVKEESSKTRPSQ